MIASKLDNDLYKFTMQYAVLENFPDVEVEGEFIDRKPTPYNDEFVKEFGREIERMAELKSNPDQMKWMADTLTFLPPHYLAYLNDYRFNPDELNYGLTPEGYFRLGVKGKWASAILWEVPVLANVSEIYFDKVDRAWQVPSALVPEFRSRIAAEKAERLSSRNCSFAEFGTRRRRSFAEQDRVVRAMKDYKGFSGTSNVHLAHLYGVKAIGTMAHEWIMGVSAMDGLRHANRHALRRWATTYKGNLGIALPDTYGIKAFFEDFDGELGRLYDGVRHDSGDPIVFGEALIVHYKKLRINPMTKFAVFTDSLSVDKAVGIRDHFAGRINVSFGIGTHFTNDYSGSPAKNIVLKLTRCNGVPVVKLSDEPAKAIGDRDAVRVAKWTFFGTPLDA